MSVRKTLYFGYHSLTGGHLGREYAKAVQQDRHGVPSDTTRKSLIRLLTYARQSVPYYARLMNEQGDSYKSDPESYLARFPILTKDKIRANFDQLKSVDLATRKWTYSTTGGSTGEPLKLIQDREYRDRVVALQMLYFLWNGRELGEPLVYVWGSERDILEGNMGLKMTANNLLTRTSYLNAFQMTPAKMRAFLDVLNARPPKLIVAFTQAIYELAKFAQQEGIAVTPQLAINTSSGTLYPTMRETIGAVFQCPVFDRYGSREVGDMACECSAHAGLHVAPWSNYLEIVNDEGRVVPHGTEGNIVVTSLANYAMPLIRYFIGDRGVLSAHDACSCGRRGQILERVLGRTIDSFKKRDGTQVHGAYFMHLLYRDWVWKFQVVQKSYTSIAFKIIKSPGTGYQSAELDEIRRKIKAVMGDDCAVTFEFVDSIPPSASGKYRYTISEVQGGLSDTLAAPLAAVV